MEFWLKKSNSDKFMLPVNPESFSFTEKHNNTSVNVNSIGEVNLIGKRGLKEGTISSFFPNQDYNFGNNSGRKAPYVYVNTILKWKEEGKPIRLIVGGNINVQVTIESFKYGEQDGTGDVYYLLGIKEYKAVTVTKVKNSTSVKTTSKKSTSTSSKSTTSSKKTTTSSKKRTTENKPKTKTYKVRKGDCLWKIAKKFYGNGALYTKIYKANKSKIKNPNVIRVGQVLTIP